MLLIYHLFFPCRNILHHFYLNFMQPSYIEAHKTSRRWMVSWCGAELQISSSPSPGKFQQIQAYKCGLHVCISAPHFEILYYPIRFARMSSFRNRDINMSAILLPFQLWKLPSRAFSRHLNLYSIFNSGVFVLQQDQYGDSRVR